MSRQMHLGVFVLGTGNHIAGWRFPGATQSFEDIAVIQQIGRIAEQGKFDLLFLGDNLATDPGMHPSFAAKFEPLTMLSALAATTTHVGLGGTASTSYTEPFNLARQFASLDHLSHGRAAWNAVTTSGDKAAANFGRSHAGHDARYEVAEEFVDVVRGLWDCWDDGAVIRDHATGRYIDASKLKPLNHVGRFFQVKGPLPTSRTPQGNPVIIQAGSSEPGLQLAARTADVVFTVVQDKAEAQAGYQALKSRLPAFGRTADEVAVLPGCMPIVGRTREEALAKLDTLMSFVDVENSRVMLNSRLGIDVSGFPLDARVPEDFPLPDTSHGFAKAMLAKAWREKLTWRDMVNLAGAARGHWVILGTPEEIADILQDWFEDYACDGFNILPAYFPGAFQDFVDLVVPILQDRGLFRRDYTGTTLREHLGLARPPSRLFGG
jgi:FMN-dependent oxidoreductase (nitrilotriacetate monooxygenase family)